MKNGRLLTGDIFILPNSEEFGGDEFVVTRSRKRLDSYYLDAICAGDESIQICVDQEEVVKIDG